ncbi:DUF6371 domain-containing protein [Psychroflexus sp. MES1-P1E]|uniref:DUF6371 domain-containing protein n=1 Tax=Psychroflexus sp. MES1-P1E TaxID=2058320 RepID=UPI0015E14FA8|nr:DUF6371 domain-containing protein [Psychroflexus sp. MES1-P1E]
MNEYRYILDRSSKKFICPDAKCTKKRFVRYIDTETGNYLIDAFGRCDRESNCGHNNDPYKSGYSKMIWEQEQGKDVNFEVRKPVYKAQPKAKKETEFIPVSELKNTLKDYEKNIFIQNLLNKIAFPFEAEDMEKIISLYRLGTVPENGAVCFPFIDAKQNIRAVQEKIFDANNNTDKNKKYHTSWLHSRLQFTEYRNKPLPEWLQSYLNNDTKVSCLFGEHLLSNYPQNPIALVVAPKTAIYGTLYFGFPEEPTNLLWLSVFNLSSLTYNKCKVLKGRDVYLFPDASKDGTAFRTWSNKASDIESKLSGTYFKVSDLLEELAPDCDKEQGNDLADYLIKQDWRKFRPQETEPQPEVLPVENTICEKREASNKHFISEEKKQYKLRYSNLNQLNNL